MRGPSLWKLGTALGVEGDDLAVEHGAVGRDGGDRARDLGVRRRRRAPVAVAQRDRAAVLVGHDAHAVELELVQALGIVEPPALGRAQHRHHLLDVHVRLHGRRPPPRPA
jgi:hypothetical protein